MVELIVCVALFYIFHLFLTMSLSLHKVPFLDWTYTGGDISNMTDLSQRMVSAGDNLRQTLPLFLVLSCIGIRFFLGILSRFQMQLTTLLLP